MTAARRRTAGGSIVRTLAVLVLVGAAVLVAVGAWGWTRLQPVDPGAAEPVAFEVLPGWGARTVAEQLEEEGLIRHAGAFLLLLRWQGSDRAIGEGLYELAPAMDARTVVARLEAGGRPRTIRVTMPEGWRARDLARRVEELGLATYHQLLQRVDDPGPLAPEGLPDGVGLEGYLYPDTYELRVDADERTLLTAMVARFEERADRDDLRARAEAEGLSLHAWVTLASIVQAEAANDGEMAIIAGVFRNRLDVGMPLQSDPTVAYGLGKDLPQLDFPGGDFDVDHPWNTYTRGGLPEGPIGNPGSAALAAVVAPERTAPNGEPWTYFLHGVDDGAPVFRPNTNFEDHVRDRNAYLR